MKELSIEQKAKAYNEALARANEMIKAMTNIGGVAKVDDIQHIFPELKESEDERVRKALINGFNKLDKSAVWYNGITNAQILAWLKNQGEKLPVGFYYVNSEGKKFYSDTFKYGNVILHVEKQGEHKSTNADNKFIRMRETKPKDISEFLDRLTTVEQEFLWEHIAKIRELDKEEQKPEGKTALEASKEEKVDNANKVEPKDYSSIDPHFFKPADKTEPRFHEGEWVVSPNGVYWHIDKISNNRYEVTSNTGESSDWNLDTNIYHKFTIQDAKDGDVLATDNGCICIFDGTVEEGKYPFAYCGVIERVFENCDGQLPFTHANVQPATKEQRDKLEKAMADAGYTFDFEKKELKKIKQKSIELDGNRSKELSLSLQIQAYLNTASDELYAKGKPLYSEKKIEYIHKCILMWQKLHHAYFYQKPVVWSKEDEKKIDSIIETIRIRKFENPQLAPVYEGDINWLKSLRPQSTWKPSDEQMEALWNVYQGGKEQAELATLYSDLKKLRNK